MEEVTVDQAIKKGLWVNAKALWLMLLFMLMGVYLFLWHQQLGALITLLIAGFTGGLFYRNIAITSWRIWAFSNVRNINELQTKAIRHNIILRPGSWFEKMEVRTFSQKQQLAALEQKTSQPDEPVDDPSVSPETILYYSKPKAIFTIIVSLPALIAGLWLMIQEQMYLCGAFFFLIGVFISWTGIRPLLNSTPQLILNRQGIQIGNKPLQYWGNISQERVEITGSARNMRVYLVYKYAGLTTRHDIADLNINPDKLEDLMHTYRARARQLS